MTNHRTRGKKYRSPKRFRGGKSLGEGKSARTIHPAIPCKDGRDLTNYVTRLLINYKTRLRKPEEDLMSNNIPLIKKLTEIDPTQKYFIYPEKCEVGELLDDNIKDGATEDNKQHSEFMKIGGETWRNFYTHRKPSLKQKNHLKKSLELLHSNGIIHGDLTSKNIIMGKDNLPRLIDFGGSVYDAPEDYIKAESDLVDLVFPTFKINPSQQKLVNDLRIKKYKLMRIQQKKQHVS